MLFTMFVRQNPSIPPDAEMLERVYRAYSTLDEETSTDSSSPPTTCPEPSDAG